MSDEWYYHFVCSVCRMLHSLRKMFVGSRDEGCQFALDATEVKTPNCEGTPPVGKGDCCISSHWERRAGIRSACSLVSGRLGVRKMASLLGIETSNQQDSQTSKKTEKHVFI